LIDAQNQVVTASHRRPSYTGPTLLLSLLSVVNYRDVLVHTFTR